MASEGSRPKVATAAAGGAASAWTRQGREALQGSHVLTAPLARWNHELLEPEPGTETAEAAEGPEVQIPEAVLHERPQQRLPEDAICRSPIAGMVMAVCARAGERVLRRQVVVVIEAMKMLNHIGPEVDGVVKALHVQPGAAVKAGQVLFELDRF